VANRRTATLNGVKTANELHARLGSREGLARGCGRIDVFQSLLDEGAVLLFRPLDGPLGVYIDEPAEGVFSPGVLVSTKRELHTQRFTAAHELGHLVFRHRPSVDTELGLWRSAPSTNLQEVEADAFATEFLTPLWLIQHHAERHGWTRQRLHDPAIVYQLSLRLCASYDATCWALQGNKLIGLAAARSLASVTPKQLKQQALEGGRDHLRNPWANVWVMTERDSGLELEGGPDDVFVFRLREHAAGGYLWSEDRLAASGFELLEDRRSTGSEVGDASTRVLIARVREAATFDLQVPETRPWLPQAPPLEMVTLTMQLEGKEVGLPRVQRRALAA